MEVSNRLQEGVLYKKVYGYKLYRAKLTTARYVVIVRIEEDMWQGRSVSLGDRVMARAGHWEIPAGAIGVVTAIHAPHENGRTNDVLDVQFEGFSSPHSMKFKKLYL